MFLIALNMSVTFVLVLRSSRGVQCSFLRSEVTLTSRSTVCVMGESGCSSLNFL